jgi:hypothetical protein
MKGFKSVGHDKQPLMNSNYTAKKNTAYNFKDNKSERVNEILEKYRDKSSAKKTKT